MYLRSIQGLVLEILKDGILKVSISHISRFIQQLSISDSDMYSHGYDMQFEVAVHRIYKLMVNFEA